MLQPPSAIDPRLDPCRSFTPEENMVRFFIEMVLEERLVEMRVPKRYLEDRFDHQDGAKHRAQLFRIEVPTFEPVTRREAGRRNRAGLSWDWMTFLVKDQLPLDHTMGLRLLTPDLPFGHLDRLREMESPPGIDDFPTEPGPHDLTRLLAPDRLHGEDMFLHFDTSGDLAGWMLCSVRGVNGTRNEGCLHTVRLSGMDVRVSYLRTELPNWAAIYRNVARFLSCATSDSL